MLTSCCCNSRWWKRVRVIYKGWFTSLSLVPERYIYPITTCWLCLPERQLKLGKRASDWNCHKIVPHYLVCGGSVAAVFHYERVNERIIDCIEGTYCLKLFWTLLNGALSSQDFFHNLNSDVRIPWIHDLLTVSTFVLLQWRSVLKLSAVWNQIRFLNCFFIHSWFPHYQRVRRFGVKIYLLEK